VLFSGSILVVTPDIGQTPLIDPVKQSGSPERADADQNKHRQRSNEIAAQLGERGVVVRRFALGSELKA
jgi:hypothetical protein